MDQSENILVDEQGNTGVVPSVSVENLVNMRAAVVDRYLQALKLLQEAGEIADAAHFRAVEFEINSMYAGKSRASDEDAPKTIQQAIDKSAWHYLMNESGMRSFMDASARKQWDDQIYNGTVPDLTIKNVESTFNLLYTQRGEMFERGVISCFQRLSWDYKTNQPFKFGKRIILNYLFSVYGSGRDTWLSLNSRTCDELEDLLRVFTVLDGKPQADHRQGIWQALSASKSAKTMEHDGEYFHLRWYKKGSGHLTFKRPDLVNRVNQILAKHYPRALAYDRK